ncbi:MAG: hypothetical protein JWR38_2500 [Mucilaginibacter sp.]|nr:hypothetical protein [Mucilaginibacter sp.]
MLCLFLFNSCKKTEKITPDSNNNNTLNISKNVSDDALAAIKKMGFSTDGALKMNGGYLVEGDIFISEASLGKVASSPNLLIAKAEQYRTYNTVLTLPRVITVSCSMGGVYNTATDQAISRYNGLNMRLSFLRVSSGGNINITGFNNGPDANGFIILGVSPNFPDGNGTPGNNIQINVNSLALPPTSDVNYITSVIQHEMGHAIGLRHTDYLNRSFSCGPNDTRNEGAQSVGAVQIPGTPSGPDSNSFMLACSNGSDRTFNANDVIALNYLYGGGGRTIRTIRSDAFNNVFLRLSGLNLTQPATYGGGTVNSQYIAGPYEQFYITLQSNGTYTIESCAFPNIFLRMNVSTLGLNQIGGTVNAQYSAAGQYEQFSFQKNADGTYYIFGSSGSRLANLRLDGNGVTSPLANGGGVVNATTNAPGAWEKFRITPDLF